MSKRKDNFYEDKSIKGIIKGLNLLNEEEKEKYLKDLEDAKPLEEDYKRYSEGERFRFETSRERPENSYDISKGGDFSSTFEKDLLAKIGLL